MADPLTGRWTWNDVSNTLEFTSKQAADRHAGKKRERRELSAGHSGHRGHRSRTARHRSPPRHTIQSSSEHTHVTVGDVKAVAWSLMADTEAIPAAFEVLYGTEQFDEFLMFLLDYFHWFFEKRVIENKPNPVHIEPSLAEQDYYAELCVKLGLAQKQIGRVYGALILGVGLCDQHHMACGRSRVSNTYKDRSMYEALYTFSAYLVWIAFKRQEYDIVLYEVNRLLRTDTFNPALRVASATSQASDEEIDSGPDERLTESETRRIRSSRPPLKAIVGQRSATLVSLLPLPKEEASWLFKRSAAKSSVTIGRRDLTEEDVKEQSKQFGVDKSQLKLGIIGEPLNLFDPVTLASISHDEAGDNNEASASELLATSNTALQDKAPSVVVMETGTTNEAA